MGMQSPTKHYGTQVKGAFIMFVAVWLAAWVRGWDVETTEIELWRRLLWYLILGGCFLVLFVVFFVGLKVFVGGLLRDLADPAAPGPDGRGGPGKPAAPPE